MSETPCTDSDQNAVYKLTIDLNVLDHLSDGLYSSVGAVLTEAVANAWDADATEVHLRMDIDNDLIEIKDNGIGMDRNAINSRYLRVGYRKRDDAGETTPRGRAVMGRKGIGKLSLFSISNVIRIESRTLSGNSEALELDVSALRKVMSQSPSSVYHPEPKTPDKAKLGNSGTRIILSGLRKDRLRETDPSSLRRRLARRFSVIGSNSFKVFVNNVEVTIGDRDDLKFSEYLWVFDGSDIPSTFSGKKSFSLTSHLDGCPDNWKIRGWLGTVDKPRQLSTPEGNLNSVVVLSRGRLVQEDILPLVSGAGVFTKYITGQIEADWLDDSNETDIVTSDRQRLRENDDRVRKLVDFLSSRITEIGNVWTSLRNEDKIDDLRNNYPGIDQWLSRLDSGWRDKAESLLGRIASMEIPTDSGDNDRTDLIRHAIYGFERLRMRGDAEQLERAIGRGVDELLRLLADRDSLEAAIYRDIARSRLEAVDQISEMVDDNALEKVLQKYLFDHLWLLDPAWDRATKNTAMEERVRLLTEFHADDNTREKYGRIDIRYCTVGGKNVLVELKRRSAKPTAGELLDQVTKYKKAMEAHFPSENFEVAIVVGQKVENASASIGSVLNGSRVFTYDELIASAKSAYGEYLERTKSLDNIDRILTRGTTTQPSLGKTPSLASSPCL